MQLSNCIIHQQNPFALKTPILSLLSRISWHLNTHLSKCMTRYARWSISNFQICYYHHYTTSSNFLQRWVAWPQLLKRCASTHAGHIPDASCILQSAFNVGNPNTNSLAKKGFHMLFLTQFWLSPTSSFSLTPRHGMQDALPCWMHRAALW